MPFDLSPSLPLHAFTGKHADALLAAADLLGGDPGRKRCARLLEDLHEGRPLTRRLAEETRWLIRLLGLEHVGDPDRNETELFNHIAPDDPVVEEICRLQNTLVEAFDASQSDARVAA